MSSETSSDDTYHRDEDTRYVFFVYDDDEDDPRFSFWMQMDDLGSGIPLYGRPEEGAGKWYKLDQDSQYDSVEPTQRFEWSLAGLATDGVSQEVFDQLPAHEQYFFRVIHGTAEENPDAIPSPLWSYIHDCEDRYVETDTDQETDA